MKPFAIDIDGVLANFHAGIEQWVRQGLMPHAIGPCPPIATHWSYADMGVWASDADFENDYERASSLGFHLEIPPIAGAVDAMCELASQGIPFFYLTARTELARTKMWLKGHKLPSAHVLSLRDKSRFPLDCVFVDDSPSQITRFERMGRDFVIVDHPYNRHLPGSRINSLAHLLAVPAQSQV